jgi:hypothetical protein
MIIPMKKYKLLLIIYATFIFVTINGCGSMFAHIFGKDHLGDKKYRFLLFDNSNEKILYGGYLEIKSIDETKFSGEFKIIDVFSESIPIGSGIVDGTQNDDRDKAQMILKSKSSEEKINVELDKTWNLLDGKWSYKSNSGKFIAFENN